MRNINITAKDGAVIPAVVCNFEETAGKGVVIVSYGFGEHMEMYTELAERLGQAGYSVILFEQRGHGAPPDGRKNWFGIIPDYQYFLDDINSVSVAARQMAPETPIVLYGHSMGGNIVINTLLRQSPECTCAILEAPWLGLNKGPGPFVIGLVKVLSRILPNMTIVNKLEINDLSGDPERAARYTTDPLYHNRISFRMFTGIDAACSYAMANAARMPVPAYIAYGKSDRIISNQAIIAFSANSGGMVTVKEYDSCHAIHNDLKREEYFADVVAFLDMHCAGD